jgi:hypothetical protein
MGVADSSNRMRRSVWCYCIRDEWVTVVKQKKVTAVEVHLFLSYPAAHCCDNLRPVERNQLLTSAMSLLKLPDWASPAGSQHFTPSPPPFRAHQHTNPVAYNGSPPPPTTPPKQRAQPHVSHVRDEAPVQLVCCCQQCLLGPMGQLGPGLAAVLHELPVRTILTRPLQHLNRRSSSSSSSSCGKSQQTKMGCAALCAADQGDKLHPAV